MAFVGASPGLPSLGAVGVSTGGGPMLAAAPTPDPDSIKLFAGQVPRSFEESHLRAVFEPFGTICDLKVLKDAYSGFHRGCCFVTFQTKAEALSAIRGLHDVKLLPGMSRKMQVKPADENKMEKRKLFIGMLPKQYEKVDLENLLAPYGTVEECNILKDEGGVSRSCGFALMKARDECDAAIAALHNKQTLSGAKSPLQVKFADTDRDRTAKRYHKAAAGLYNGIPFAGGAVGNPLPQAAAAATAPLALYQQIAALHSLLNSAGGGAGPSAAASGTDQATLANLALYQQLMSGSVPVPQATVAAGHHQYPQQKEGPDGANLFIYHIPAEFRDPDLVQMFAPFGSVISARVFIDKATNQSKCFGFVSYTTPDAAQSAIQSMNGFQIGTKRLKVSLKRGGRGAARGVPPY